MAFKFSLAAVLRVRESIERREELALQRIQFEIARIRRRIDELNDQITGKHNARNESMRQPVYSYEVQAILHEVNAAMDLRQALHGSLGSLELERETRMKAYQTAYADRQMLTDMLVQKQNEYEQEQVRTQQKSIDEMFASRSQRN
ncbi:MAG: flagellar FliJ family protein [Terracidiphilus sp.]